MIYLAQVGSFHNVICAIEAAQKNGFNNTNDMLFFIIHREPLFLKWSIVEKILESKDIKSNKIFIETINERTFDKKKIKEIKKNLFNEIKQADFLITQFNSGIGFTIIKWGFNIKKIILIDDGSANYARIKHRGFLLKYIQYMYIGLKFDTYNKYKLGLSNNYDVYYSCLEPKFLKCNRNKTEMITSEVSKAYNEVIELDKFHFSKIVQNHSLLFCSNHSIQSNRIDQNSYYRIIEDKISFMKANYDIENLYLCMHPAEPIKNLDFYSSLGLINLEKYSAEFYLQSHRFDYCLHPCNSVPMVCESINKTSTRYFSYLLPGITLKSDRIFINNHYDELLLD